MTLETVLADHDGKDYARRVLEATEVWRRSELVREAGDKWVTWADKSHEAGEAFLAAYDGAGAPR
jgi:hypothetical protein